MAGGGGSGSREESEEYIDHYSVLGLARLERTVHDSLSGSKRRKVTSDLEQRERAASREADTVDSGEVKRQKEKKIAAELKRELGELQARKVKKAAEPSGFASVTC